MFFKALYDKGAEKQNIVVKIAGGASLRTSQDFFAIGRRNLSVAQKLFDKNGIQIQGQDVGGPYSRTMYMEIKTGRVWITSAGKEMDI